MKNYFKLIIWDLGIFENQLFATAVESIGRVEVEINLNIEPPSSPHLPATNYQQFVHLSNFHLNPLR